MMRKLIWFAVLATGFVAGTSLAASVHLPGGSLTIPGPSTSGVSFTYTGTLTQEDTIALIQSGNPCLQSGGTYCINGAGVVTVAGTTGVGGATSFPGPSGIIPVGPWTFGSLVMLISGVDAVQVFPTNVANGLGSPTPPTNLMLPPTRLADLGFPNFSVSNPTITFIVADTLYTDNSGEFVLTQPASPAPAASHFVLLALGALLTAGGVYLIRRRAVP